MQIVDPVPGLRKLQSIAAAGTWLRALARASADEIEGLRSVCGGHVARKERRRMWMLAVVGAIFVALWVLGALGFIDFHVYIGAPGTGPGGHGHGG